MSEPDSQIDLAIYETIRLFQPRDDELVSDLNRTLYSMGYCFEFAKMLVSMFQPYGAAIYGRGLVDIGCDADKIREHILAAEFNHYCMSIDDGCTLWDINGATSVFDIQNDTGVVRIDDVVMNDIRDHSQLSLVPVFQSFFSSDNKVSECFTVIKRLSQAEEQIRSRRKQTGNATLQAVLIDLISAQKEKPR